MVRHRGRKKIKKYAVFTEDISSKDKYKVTNYHQIPKYNTRAEAEKHADKRYGDKVFEVEN